MFAALTEIFYIAIDGQPITLGPGECLDGVHLVIQSPQYGRVLFTDNWGVNMVGPNAIMMNCVIEYL